MPGDDAAQNPVDLPAEGRPIRPLVRIGRIAGAIGHMPHDVVGIGRVQAPPHEREIFPVRLFFGAQTAVLPQIGSLLLVRKIVPAVRMHAVDDEIGAVFFRQRRIQPPRLRIVRIAELPADENLHPARVFRLQRARRGEIGVRIGVRRRFAAVKGNAVHEIVVVEMLGNAVNAQPLAVRRRQHVGKRAFPVRRKGRMGMYIGKNLLHAPIIPQSAENGK